MPQPQNVGVSFGLNRGWPAWLTALLSLALSCAWCQGQASAEERPAVRTLAHTSVVRALAFSADGKRLLAAGPADPTIPVWDVTTGEEVGRFGPHHGGVWALALSPDGKRLAVSHAGGNVLLREFPSGELLRELKGYAYQLAFSADGRLLAGVRSETVNMWQVSKPEDPQTFEVGRTGGSLPVCFSRDGRLLFLGGAVEEDYRQPEPVGVRIRDLKSGSEGIAWSGTQIAALALLPRSECLVAVSVEEEGRYVTFWDDSFRRPLKRVACPLAKGDTLAFSPDGRLLLSAGQDASLRLWDLLSGAEVWRRPWAGLMVTALTFSPDGRRFATGARDGTVRIWELAALMEEEGGPRSRLWRDLKATDGAKAFRAQRGLLRDPEATVAEVQKYAAVRVHRKKVARLLADLDGPSYAVRVRATSALVRLGPAATALVEARRANPPNLEVQRRLEPILQAFEQRTMQPSNLWRFRTIALLEAVATPGARRALTRMAEDAPGLMLMRDARLALQRLDGRTR